MVNSLLYNLYKSCRMLCSNKASAAAFSEERIVDNSFMTSDTFQVIIFLLLFSMADDGRRVASKRLFLSFFFFVFLSVVPLAVGCRLPSFPSWTETCILFIVNSICNPIMRRLFVLNTRFISLADFICCSKDLTTGRETKYTLTPDAPMGGQVGRTQLVRLFLSASSGLPLIIWILTLVSKSRIFSWPMWPHVRATCVSAQLLWKGQTSAMISWHLI